MVLTYNQKYSIASTLATMSLNQVIEKLGTNLEAIDFAKSIDKFYKIRNGFILSKVLKILLG